MAYGCAEVLGERLQLVRTPYSGAQDQQRSTLLNAVSLICSVDQEGHRNASEFLPQLQRRH